MTVARSLGQPRWAELKGTRLQTDSVRATEKSVPACDEACG